MSDVHLGQYHLLLAGNETVLPEMMFHPDDYSDVGDKGDIMNQKSLSVLGTSAGEAFKIILLQIAEAIYPDSHNHWKWKITINERKRSYWRETVFLLIHDYGRKGIPRLFVFFFSLPFFNPCDSLLGLGTVQEQLRPWPAVGFICVT